VRIENNREARFTVNQSAVPLPLIMPSENHPDFDPVLGSQLLAAAHAQDSATLQALLQRDDVDINIVGPDNLNALMISVVKGDHAAVAALVARPDLLINTQIDGGFSALMLASILNTPELVQTLLTRADLQINDANLEGNTALMLAATQGHVQVIELFKNRADAAVNTANLVGGTALMLAAIAGKLDAVECLKEFAGIDLNAVDGMYCTALMHAVVNKHPAIVQSLKHCADINATDSANWTALMYAADAGAPDIVLSLLQVGHVEHDTLNQGVRHSALMIAASNDDELSVKHLIDFGANVLVCAADGRTAREIAHDKGHIAIAETIALEQQPYLDDLAQSLYWVSPPVTPDDEEDYPYIHELVEAADAENRLTAIAEQESSTNGSLEPLASDFALQ
jgi:ankyrin repeat protein